MYHLAAENGNAGGRADLLFSTYFFGLFPCDRDGRQNIPLELEEFVQRVFERAFLVAVRGESFDASSASVIDPTP
jgi:hypothetical protein